MAIVIGAPEHGHPPTASVVRVVVATSDADAARSFQIELARHAGFTVCAVADEASAAIEATVAHRPDICVLDVRLPGNGIAAAWEIAARLPETKIVMLGAIGDDQELFAALRAGASGFLPKDIAPTSLTATLLGVVRGEAAISRTLVARLLEEFRDRSARRRALVSAAPSNQLTSREWQVLELLRQDLGTADIARRLCISPATVRTHVSSILQKLGLPDREAVHKL